MVRKAIIPAAGYGIRSLPITKVIPKEMFPIGLKPAIHYIVEEAVSSGIEQILIITSRSRDLIMDYFDYSIELETILKIKNKNHLEKKLEIPNVEIFYKRQAFAKGLGDAIRLGKEFVGNDPFAVLLPDDIVIPAPVPALKELIEVHKETQSNVMALKQVKQDYLKDYGVIQGKLKDGFIEIQDIVEKPVSNPPSDLAVIGRYIFTPKLFTFLELTKIGIGGEIQLTDAIKGLLVAEPVLGKIISGDRYDVGNLKDYVELINRLSKDD